MTPDQYTLSQLIDTICEENPPKFSNILELTIRIVKLHNATEELKRVVKEKLLPICQKHGGEIWLADGFTIESAFSAVDEALKDTEYETEDFARFRGESGNEKKASGGI